MEVDQVQLIRLVQKTNMISRYLSVGALMSFTVSNRLKSTRIRAREQKLSSLDEQVDVLKSK